jgi:branched-chain amino acid transport system permease protein
MDLFFWIALPLAALISGLVGILCGIPILRVKGFYVVIITLVAGLILPGIISLLVLPHFNQDPTAMIVPYPMVGGRVLNSHVEMFYPIMAIMFLVIILVAGLARSRTNRAFNAIRDNEVVSGILGINVPLYRLLAFFVCCLLAGVGGSLWAHWVHAVSVTQFSYVDSIWYLGIIIVGGIGSITGVVLGAIILRGVDFLIVTYFLPALTDMALAGTVPGGLVERGLGFTPFIIGAIVLLFLILAPGGVVRWGSSLQVFYRLWPFSRAVC